MTSLQMSITKLNRKRPLLESKMVHLTQMYQNFIPSGHWLISLTLPCLNIELRLISLIAPFILSEMYNHSFFSMGRDLKFIADVTGED